jgi:hypothetical protein
VTQVTRGYLTQALGSAAWVDTAIDCALSLRAFDSAPVALATDATLAPVAQRLVPAVFSQVMVLPPNVPLQAAKFHLQALTPFAQSVYVDADSIALASLARCFDPLQHHDVVLVGERYDLRSDDLLHQGRSVHRIIRETGITEYLKCNGGLFAFNKDRTADIFAELLRVHRDVSPSLVYAWLRAYKEPGDELAFGIVGGARRFGTFDDFQPMMWSHELATLDIERPTKALFHQIGPVPDRTLDAVLAVMGARRRAVGLEFTSEQWWRRRNAMLRWRRRIGTPRWLELISRLDHWQSRSR